LKIFKRRRFWAPFTVLLFIGAAAMRLHHLGTPHAFDLDEGVYWQTLRAMSYGERLYSRIYFSQPPYFAWTVYPVYALLGHSILAARMGIAVASILGLCGAYLFSQCVAGRTGALAAVAILVASAPYLAMSQTLQAEGPAIGLSLLGIGLAFVAYCSPLARRDVLLCGAAGVCLGIGILSKLLAVCAVVPIGVLIGMKYALADRDTHELRRITVATLAMAGGFALVVACAALYVRNDLSDALTQIIGYHLSAAAASHFTQRQNLAEIASLLVSPLGAAALVGIVAAIMKRDPQLLPMFAWLVCTVIMLANLVPLFAHHLVALVPPLTGLSILTFSPGTRSVRDSLFARGVLSLGILAVGAALAVGILLEFQYYNKIVNRQVYGVPQAMNDLAVHDLQRYTKPDERVVTDAQFLVAQADRDTPAWLVDTTLVRIYSGQLPITTLIQDSSAPDVHAVLFYGDRLSKFPAFRAWVSRNFRLVDRFGGTNALWIR
jgi:4-amino-4-deoxy-L-arabinose transferase-like glycosyltransferase